MNARSLLLLTLVAGPACTTGLTGLEPDTDAVALAITGVSPADGPADGGTEVVITGEGFAAPAQVFFGSEPAAAEVRSSGAIAATAPAGAPGSVDVRVLVPRGEVTAPAAFRYTPAEADCGGDTGVSAAGKVVGFVELSHKQVACPACLDGRTEELEVGAAAIFHAPTDDRWLGWLPAMGACIDTLIPDPLDVQSVSVGEVVTLRSGTTSLTLAEQPNPPYGPSYFVSGLDTDDVVRNAGYQLRTDEPGPLCATVVDNALSTGGGFTDLQPAALLGPTHYAVGLSRSAGATLTYAPNGGSFAVGQIAAYAPDGTPRGGLTCTFPDAGTILFPAGELSAWPAGTRALVTLWRYRTRETELANGALLEGAVSFGVEVTAVITP
jgi:hypothetical protein